MSPTLLVVIKVASLVGFGVLAFVLYKHWSETREEPCELDEGDLAEEFEKARAEGALDDAEFERVMAVLKQTPAPTPPQIAAPPAARLRAQRPVAIAATVATSEPLAASATSTTPTRAESTAAAETIATGRGTAVAPLAFGFFPTSSWGELLASDERAATTSRRADVGL